MTFDLILSSLYYNVKEWFVLSDILTHLPHEKAAAVMQRYNKTTAKDKHRLGISRDWVAGDRKKVLVERHFIDSNDPGRSLIFSNVLIDAGHVEELFLESFTKKFRLKVQQFHLTANSLDSFWFEWQFDPKQKEGHIVKKSKLVVDENDRESSVSSKGQDKTPQNDQNRHSDSENLAPNLSAQSTECPQSLKRRRSGNQPASNFSSSISESVLMRPRKKAKEAQDDDIPKKEEPMSPDYKPDLNNLPDVKIKSSLSPIQKLKIKLSPNSSPQMIVKNDVMLSSVSATDNIADSVTDCNHSNIDTSQEGSANPKNSDNLNQSDELLMQNNQDSAMENDIESSIGNDLSQVNMALNNQDMPDEINNADRGNPGFDNTLDDSNIASNSPVGNSIEDSNSTDDGNVPDSNLPDDDNLVAQNVSQAPSSPTSSLLDNSKDIMENIKLREQELCNDNEGDTTSEVPSTSADTNPATHKHDCGAETCTSNGASSTVCLCTDQETSKKEKPIESVGSTEASELLDGLIAAGFIDHVRQLLENFHGDTRLSKMEAELNTLRSQINQKRKANSQLQKSIKKKAGELEKLFDNLRKGKANCEMLEQKYKALQVEKSTVEAKVKKCLEVLNSVD